MITGYYRSRI